MKKIMLLAMVSGLMSLTSCYTKYSCSCNGIDSSGNAIEYHQDVHGSQQKAQEKCAQQRTMYENAGARQVQCAVPI